MSASGGKGACIQNGKVWVASGAGGGGFIGLNWSMTTSQPVVVGLNTDVSGGALDVDSKGSSCNLIPTKELLESTRGFEGQALSISGCPKGQAGLFCHICPKGEWSDEGLMCHRCNPIPSRGTFSEEGWYTPDCPYSCGVGVPNKASNPDCFLAFANFFCDLFYPLSLLSLLRNIGSWSPGRLQDFWKDGLFIAP